MKGKDITGLSATLIASALLILVGIVYFMVTVLVIRTGARWAGLISVSSDTVVLTAGIITAASMIGSRQW